MRFDYWTVVRFLHVTAAIVWVGGQLVLSMIVRPVAMKSLDESTRRTTLATMGNSFARIGFWGLFPILLATGLALSYQRGVLYSAFQIPGYGAILTVKVVFAIVSFVLAAAHGVAAARSSVRMARFVGISGAAVSLAVVLLGVTLVL